MSELLHHHGQYSQNNLLHLLNYNVPFYQPHYNYYLFKHIPTGETKVVRSYWTGPNALKDRRKVARRNPANTKFKSDDFDRLFITSPLSDFTVDLIGTDIENRHNELDLFKSMHIRRQASLMDHGCNGRNIVDGDVGRKSGDGGMLLLLSDAITNEPIFYFASRMELNLYYQTLHYLPEDTGGTSSGKIDRAMKSGKPLFNTIITQISKNRNSVPKVARIRYDTNEVIEIHDSLMAVCKWIIANTFTAKDTKVNGLQRQLKHKYLDTGRPYGDTNFIFQTQKEDTICE